MHILIILHVKLGEFNIGLFVRFFVDGVLEVIDGFLGVSQSHGDLAQDIEQFIVVAIDAIGIFGCFQAAAMFAQKIAI